MVEPEDDHTGGLGAGDCGLGQANEQIKWQTANGKFQMVFHLPFALCHLNFEFLLPPFVGEGLVPSPGC